MNLNPDKTQDLVEQPTIEIAADPAEALPETGAAPRRPRLIDHVLLPATPWCVAPSYLAQSEHTEMFLKNAKMELLNPRTVVFVADEARGFLATVPLETWDVTRDVPNIKPAGDIVFWEWRDPESRDFTGALCKGVAKPTLSAAIEQFEAIQEQVFDYDVAVVLESAHKAATSMDASEARAPVMFLTGTIIRSETPTPDPSKPQKPLPELRPLGSFAVTMRADGRPVPDSLSLMLWDDSGSVDIRFNRESLHDELYDALTVLLLMHTLLRALEVKTVPHDAEVFQSRTDTHFHGVGLANYYELQMGTLPKKLREEGFADKDGLKKALFYMAGKFVTAPVVWSE